MLPQAEREARIAEENSSMGPSSRVVEETALIEKLSVRVPVSLHGRCVLLTCMMRSPQPLGLVMREIKADGHCLYRSVEDQLAIEQGEYSAMSLQHGFASD